MKLVKLERIKLGENYPIVRITLKNLFGKEVVKDCIRTKNLGFWWLMDKDRPAPHSNAIETFYESGEHEYTVNKSNIMVDIFTEPECSHENLPKRKKEMHKERCPDCGRIVLAFNLSDLSLEEIPEKQVE